MFYRFKSKLATQDRLEAFPVPIPGSGKDHYGPWITGYEEKFIPQKTNIPNLHCKQFLAPVVNGERYGLALKFHLEKKYEQMPDIWGVADRLIVSAKFKKVLDAIDSTEHTYLPIAFVDHNGQFVHKDQTYYWFNPRVFLKITPNERRVTLEEIGFIPISGEEDFLARVIDEPVLRKTVESIPCWRHYGLDGSAGRFSQARMIVYFNELVVARLRAAGVIGMDEFTQKNGFGEESLVSI